MMMKKFLTSIAIALVGFMAHAEKPATSPRIRIESGNTLYVNISADSRNPEWIKTGTFAPGTEITDETLQGARNTLAKGTRSSLTLSPDVQQEADRVRFVQRALGNSIQWGDPLSWETPHPEKVIKLNKKDRSGHGENQYNYDIFVKLPGNNWFLIGALSDCSYTPSPNELRSVLTQLKGGKVEPKFTPTRDSSKSTPISGDLIPAMLNRTLTVDGGSGRLEIDGKMLKAFRSNAGGKEKEITVGTLKAPLSIHTLNEALTAISNSKTQSGKTPEQVAAGASNEFFDVSASVISTGGGVVARALLKSVSDRQFVQNLLTAFITAAGGDIKTRAADAVTKGKTNQASAISTLERVLPSLDQKAYTDATADAFNNKIGETARDLATGFSWKA